MSKDQDIRIVDAKNCKFHVFLDFDGTILKQSSIPWFEYLQVKPDKVPYARYLKAYMQDYNKWKNKYIPAREQRTSLTEEYNYLSRHIIVEQASIRRIEEEGWLAGVKWSKNDTTVFDDAVAKIPGGIPPSSWRAGLPELCDYILGSHGRVDMLSVNWSEQFIRALLKTRQEDDGFVWQPSMNIFCNEINPDGSGTISRLGNLFESKEPGPLNRIWPPLWVNHKHGKFHLWTALDKSLIMWHKGHENGMNDAIVMYVGDSKTDLTCLMDADIGIRVVDDIDTNGEQTGLGEVLERLHIKQGSISNLTSLSPVFLRGHEYDDVEVWHSHLQATRIIWTARDFAEIKDNLEKWVEKYKNIPFEFRRAYPAPPETGKHFDADEDSDPGH